SPPSSPQPSLRRQLSPQASSGARSSIRSGRKFRSSQPPCMMPNQTRASTPSTEKPREPQSLQWRAVVDQIRPKVPKLAAIMDDAEPDVLAYMTFPKEHRATLHSINPVEIARA